MLFVEYAKYKATSPCKSFYCKTVTNTISMTKTVLKISNTPVKLFINNLSPKPDLNEPLDILVILDPLTALSFTHL